MPEPETHAGTAEVIVTGTAEDARRIFGALRDREIPFIVDGKEGHLHIRYVNSEEPYLGQPEPMDEMGRAHRRDSIIESECRLLEEAIARFIASPACSPIGTGRGTVGGQLGRLEEVDRDLKLHRDQIVRRWN